MKLSEYEPLEAMMILMKGESGAGKTTAAASFPEPIYFACCDGRIAPLKYNPLVRKRNIEFDVFTNFNDAAEKVISLQNDCPYKTVVIDPLFGYARLVISHCIGARGGQTEIKIQGEKVPLNIGGIPIMAINEYKGEESALFNLIMSMRIMKQHNINVILTAHVVTSEQPKLGGGSTVTRRLLTGGNKIAAEIPTYFDEVYHFSSNAPGFAEANKFVCYTQGTGDDYARSSFYGIEKEIEFTNDLFYDKLIDAIRRSQEGNIFAIPSEG